MSDVPDHTGLPDDDWLAAEYALGVLAAPERAAAARRIAREHAFAAQVASWEERLAPWAAEIAEEQPPPQVWERIAAQLPARGEAGGSLWESLAFWRVFSLASALAAACLAAFIYFGAINEQPPLMAAIEGGGTRTFVATIDTKRGTIAVVPAAYSPDATRFPELWLIPADGRPRPVGMLKADRAVTLTLPPELAAFAKRDVTLAVSLEPEAGSPTGAPTGPVIGAGKLTSL
jgi:anti-sigma-K factor RskA